ncbi:MAG: DUF177 domain-containing protein [Oscillospiraceae bacterium]|nr:DUF177 domain-containing protein [Oscillospiraceae bacterium]MBO5917809.1 DUF177 domain-containing protein [Oscillospiraceae bacterium]
MKLDLRKIIHVPGASAPFDFPLDLTHLDFYGARPISRPIRVQGKVTNRAGALLLEGTASTVLDLTCDRCCKPFAAEKTVALDSLLATELENEDSEDEFILVENGAVDLDEAASTAFILAMDTTNLCSEDCKGLCDRCGADLNLGPCGCRPEVDPRLAALAQLLDDKAE